MSAVRYPVINYGREHLAGTDSTVPAGRSLTMRKGKLKRRLKLAFIILFIYFALIGASGAMFLGTEFVPHFVWISIAYGALVLLPVNIAFAKYTQRYFYRRIHKLVYADEDITLGPGELPAARRQVIALPWIAATRDNLAWVVSNAVYCFLILRPYAMVTHDSVFPVSTAYWVKAFVLVSFPFLPLCFLAALLAYSAATMTYVQFFFRQGEYEQYKLALTAEKRRFMYVALISYTLVLVIGALNYSFASHNFASIAEAFKSMQETEVVGAYLLVVVLSLLIFLSKQEERTQRKLPLFLEERTRSIKPMDKRCPKCNITVGFGIDICPQDGTPLTFAGDESESFGSSYEFLEEIARGGMCVLYKARHRLLKKVVAIKMLDTRLVGQEHAAERFVYEARAASNLYHRNIVSVLDFGQFESEKLFLVMEYLPGSTLGNLVSKTENGLPLEDCLDIFDQVCDAMNYAHLQKILHRDLKPSNIMVEEHNGKYDVKVVDFGIAKLLEGTVSNLTKTGDVFGTPDYMSPEQCMGQQLDMRSDIYSMGCLMYEALTGERPACSEGALATMYKQINQIPQPIHELRPELSQVPQLQAIISRALAKSPNNRYASFDELRTALRTVSYVTQTS